MNERDIPSRSGNWHQNAVLIAVGFFCLAPDCAFAATLTVTNLGPGGPGSLPSLVAAANSGDTIRFAATGIIRLNNTLLINKSIAIEGPGSPDLIVLEPGTGEFGERFQIGIIEIASQVSPVTLSGLTLQNGLSLSGGGALKCSRSTVFVRNCVFSTNSSRARGGGAVLAESCNLTVIDCQFSRNWALKSSPAVPADDPYGGAIYNVRIADAGSALLQVTNCYFYANLATFEGGAIANHAGPGEATLSVAGSEFSHNSSDNAGGAIVNSAGGGSRAQATITGCVFTDNRAILGLNASGGAVMNDAFRGGVATCWVTNSTFENNDAEDAGAVANYYSSDDTPDGRAVFTVSHSTLVNNTGNRGVGAARNASSSDSPQAEATLEFINCTLSKNSAVQVTTFQNSAAGASTSTLNITGCTLVDNIPLDDAGYVIANLSFSGGNSVIRLANSILASPDLPFLSHFQVMGGAITSLGYNLSTDEDSGFLTGPGDQINTDPKLDPAGLQENGGPTKTIALMAGSPALDRGFSFGLTTDQRGQPRPWDLLFYPFAPGGDDCDVGAFESTDPIQPTPIIVTTLQDHDDGIAGAADCTLREALARASLLGSNAVVAFDPGLTGLISLSANLGPLAITGSLQLDGPGARVLAVSADRHSRVLTVATNGAARISGLTLRRGYHGGLLPGETGYGAGILNAGMLTLEDCTLDDHYARGEQGPGMGGHGGAGRGGGIYNDGGLTLNRCTLRNCVVGGGNGTPDPDPFASGGNGGAAEGAAIYNTPSGSLTINNCTFSQNEASGGYGGDAHFAGNGGHARGAVFNAGTMTMTATTLSENDGLGGLGGIGNNLFNNGAPGAGTGGVANGDGGATLRNTLCAGNTARGNVPADMNGTFLSGGYNLIGAADGSTGLNATGDQTGSNASPLDARLEALRNNGGPTDTMMLLAGSPAIDRGRAFGLMVDQRVQTRPFDLLTFPNAPGGDGSDIGAVEFAGHLIVTTLDDHDDGTANSADTTLREAINAAIAQPGTEVITFLPGLTGHIQLATALPNLSSDLFIEGPGASQLTVRRNGAGNFRIFTISGGASVTISGLTVTNGNVGSGAFPADSGGGILNDHSQLTLQGCRIMGNNAVSGFTYGGGVFNHQGTLVIESCLFAGNNAYYGGGVANNCTVSGSATASLAGSTFAGNSSAGGYGGAIFNSAVGFANAPMAVVNCTLSGNSAAGGFGGAIYNSAANSGIGSLTLTHCTLSGNSAPSGGGIYNYSFNGAANVTLRNSIVNTGDSGRNLVNSGGTISSQGYNLSNDDAGGDGATGPGGFLNAIADVRNTDPLLGALAGNGGPTPTHLPLHNSPALDHGHSFGFPLDQRGLARVVNGAHLPDAPGGDGADIGAVEVNPSGSSVDADGDGMPDEWENFYGVDDPNGDPDGDGDTNLEEFQAGTNARDSSSFVLRISSVERSGNDIVITFNGVAGRTFRLERKEELSNLTWQSIAGQADLTPAITGQAQVTHAGAFSSQQGFYRIRLLP